MRQRLRAFQPDDGRLAVVLSDPSIRVHCVPNPDVNPIGEMNAER